MTRTAVLVVPIAALTAYASLFGFDRGAVYSGFHAFYPVGAISDMADAYIAGTQIVLAHGHLVPTPLALELSIRIFAKPGSFNALARNAYFDRDYIRARALVAALALDPNQADIR